MWWNVTIRETLVRVVAVEAEDAYAAEGRRIGAGTVPGRLFWKLRISAMWNWK